MSDSEQRPQNPENEKNVFLRKIFLKNCTHILLICTKIGLETRNPRKMQRVIVQRRCFGAEKGRILP